MADTASLRRTTIRGAATIAALGLLTAGVAWAETAETALASPWVVEQAARTRVVAGAASGPGQPTTIYAGLEIRLEDGWKTYWRNPGSSGVPPRIDVEGSENLAKAELLFPAPHRFKDRDGDTIGYKQTVVLPVALTPKDPSKPIVLKLAAELGICREVCIPVQPSLGLTVPAGTSNAPPAPALVAALARVPELSANLADAPRVERIRTELSGAKPRVVIDAQFPGDADGGDIFLEAPDGAWIPLPTPAGLAESGARRFVVDLSDGTDLADLRGRAIRATLVSGKGQSETRFDLVEAR
ncbi:MAG: protein-disulfide reductase DsbD domain-containing protein [Hyphomicrobiaceae bacterium]